MAKRGEDYGWWKWMAPPLMWLLQAYLRGEDITAVCDDALAAVGIAPPAAAEPPPSPAPDPIPEARSGTDAGGWTPQVWSEQADRAMRERRPGGDAPAPFGAALNEIGPAIDREKERRRQLGDSASVERFEREIAQRSAALTADDWGRTWDEGAAQARGYVGFWGWIPPAVAELEQAFLRGDDMSAPVHGPSPLPGPAPAPAAPAVPRPERWEPDWSPDEDVTMRKWADKGGGAVPDCFHSNLKHMLAAIERERKRRREIGDIASVDLYDLRKDHILNAATDNEAELRRMQETARTKAPGFWAFLPGKLGQLNQAFLRGDLPAVKEDEQTEVVKKTRRWSPE